MYCMCTVAVSWSMAVVFAVCLNTIFNRRLEGRQQSAFIDASPLMLFWCVKTLKVCLQVLGRGHTTVYVGKK